MGNQILAKYYINHKNYDILGCWDNSTPENEFDFYDVYDTETGQCINEGEPFYTFPTYDELKEFIDEGLAV